MRTLFRTLTCALLATAIAGCGIVYQPPLQQGNLVNKKALAKLKPGMTKRQIIALMGTPSIASPFDHKRWDYVHAFAVNGGKMQIRKLTLFFNNGTLVRKEGALYEANNKKMLKQARTFEKAGADNGGGTKGDRPSDSDSGGGN